MNQTIGRLREAQGRFKDRQDAEKAKQVELIAGKLLTSRCATAGRTPGPHHVPREHDITGRSENRAGRGGAIRGIEERAGRRECGNCHGFLGSRVSADASSPTFRRWSWARSAIEPQPPEFPSATLGVAVVLGEDTQPVVPPPTRPVRERGCCSTPAHAGRTPFNVTCPSSTSTVMTVRRLPLPVQNVGSSSNRSVMSCWKSSSSSSSEIARLACVLIHLSHRVQCPQRIPADSTFGSAVPWAVHLLRRRNRLHGSCQLLFRLSGSASSGFRNATGPIVCPGFGFWSIPVTGGRPSRATNTCIALLHRVLRTTTAVGSHRDGGGVLSSAAV